MNNSLKMAMVAAGLAASSLAAPVAQAADVCSVWLVENSRFMGVPFGAFMPDRAFVPGSTDAMHNINTAALIVMKMRCPLGKLVDPGCSVTRRQCIDELRVVHDSKGYGKGAQEILDPKGIDSVLDAKPSISLRKNRGGEADHPFPLGLLPMVALKTALSPIIPAKIPWCSPLVRPP